MKTLHVEIGEIAGISSDNWQGAGFGGPLVMTLQTNPMFEGPSSLGIQVVGINFVG